MPYCSDFLNYQETALGTFMFFLCCNQISIQFKFPCEFNSIVLQNKKKPYFILLQFILLPLQSIWLFFLNFQCFIPILFIKLHTSIAICGINFKFNSSISLCLCHFVIPLDTVDFDEPFSVLVSIFNLFHFIDISSFSTHNDVPLLTEFHF